MLRTLPLDSIARNPEQPREDLGPDLASLAESIRTHGLLSPLLVRRDEASRGERYILIAGERRWRAAGMAGLKEVPALVREGSPSRRDQLVLALVENLQRDDLDPVEEARSFLRLTRDLGLSQEDVARFVGRDRTTVTNALRLLRLPEEALEALRERRISPGHAKALLALPDPALVPEVLTAIETRDLSVRATERLVGTLKADPVSRPLREPPLAVRSAADLLTRSLGARVQIRPQSRGGGTIVIHYGGQEELTSLVERLRGE